ncbi:hypothetical protein ACH5RR_007402 [Cinchona calisaya]|uniref:3,9-dihydroxypterocarpan 6A-monooxygenase n=1 Tax=Cinchona calisaya TaxID=153742 RepID=A0ABD3ARQ7_9GENT
MADFQEYIIIFLIFLISTILFRQLFRTQKLPPGPLALPIIGHLHLLSPAPHKALHKLSMRYGPLFRVNFGSIPCIVASSPEIAKECLKTHEISFSNRPQIASISYLTYGSQDFAFAPYGPYWKFIKKLCMSKLLGGQTLDLLFPIRHSEVKNLIESFLMYANAGKSVNIREELMRTTNNVISGMIMSERCSGNDYEAVEVRKLIIEAAELCGQFNLSDLFWFCKNLDLQGFGKRLKKVRDKYDEMMKRIIEDHQEKRKAKEVSDDSVLPAVKDLLDILLDISEDQSSEFKLTEENIKAFILDVFTGGSDTSAIAVEWALAELINHPNIMEKVAQEIDFVVGKNRLVQESDIPKLPYLQAVVKESLRLHPPGGSFIVRESSEHCNIEGYHIPAKTRLLVNVWAIYRDPKYWENPLEFQPERFLTEDQGSLKGQFDVRGQHYHFLPFGSGRRGCPGISLALQVVQTSLAAMVQCFQWKVVDGKGNNGTIDMEEGKGATLPRAHPLVCVPVLRVNPLPPI